MTDAQCIATLAVTLMQERGTADDKTKWAGTVEDAAFLLRLAQIEVRESRVAGLLETTRQ